MDFYFAPLACSLATRIALYEAEAPARFIYVDIHTDPSSRKLADGSDYYLVNTMGQVPAIRIPNGELLTENAVVLQYVADTYARGILAPQDELERYRMQSWLNFIATELHKATYIPLLGRANADDVKAFAREKLALRFGHLNSHLEGRDFLLDGFSVADCYLWTVLNWSPHAGIDRAEWPAVERYFQRLGQRASIAKAVREEAQLYGEEMARMKKAS
jgi:glutathione S-transferase